MAWVKSEGFKNLDDVYKLYLSRHPKGDVFHVSAKVHKGICKRFNQLITKKIVDENYVWKLPHRMGYMRVRKFRMKFISNKMTLNFKEYNETGIKTYYMNDHSNNYYYKWKWERVGFAIQNKGKYRFKAPRANNRYLAKVIKSKAMDYYE